MAGVEGINLVDICGPSCSGKTSLATELAVRDRGLASVLSLDEYDLFPEGSEAMDRELAHPTITNWEDPALFDMKTFVSDVARIAGGQRVLLQTRSRESMEKGDTQRWFQPRRLNIIEGIFVLNYRARRYMDLSYFIEIPLDLMVERRLYHRRDDGKPWSDPDYIKGPMVEATKRFVMPQQEFADVVLHGGEQTIGQMADTIMADVVLLHQ